MPIAVEVADGEGGSEVVAVLGRVLYGHVDTLDPALFGGSDEAEGRTIDGPNLPGVVGWSIVLVGLKTPDRRSRRRRNRPTMVCFNSSIARSD